MTVKIIEPVKKVLAEFETPEEFNLYYHQHKEELDKQTTHILNKKYKIKGYHITKLKGNMCLKKLKEPEEVVQKSLEERIAELEKKIAELYAQVDEILKAFSR